MTEITNPQPSGERGAAVGETLYQLCRACERLGEFETLRRSLRDHGAGSPVIDQCIDHEKQHIETLKAQIMQAIGDTP